MSLLLKTIFNQISCATGKKNSLLMLLSHSIISGKTISGKNLPKNARKKLNTPKRSVNLLCRLTGSKKNLKKLSDLTTRVNLVRNLSTTKELPVSTGAKLPGINRTSVYYGGIPVSEEDWNANLSLTICIRIILPGEPVRCLLNLNCADIRLVAVKRADICVKWTLHQFIQR